MIDVAREAGVSASTVSRILNGTARVAASKRKAVEDAIQRLEFRPNLSARSLRQGCTMTIGIVTQHVESAFFGRAISGIEAGLAGSGYAPIMVSGHWNAVEEAERIRLLMARRIDGLIVLTGHLEEGQIVDFARRQPVVVTGRQVSGPNVGSVKLDQAAGGGLATRHLLTLGHRHIAHIAGPRDHDDALEREQGYVRALEEAGVEADPQLLMQGDFSELGGLQAMNQLLDSGRPVTAVFCANDRTAFGARMALYRRGVRVPDDVALVGFDDLPASAFLPPPLTTVRQPLHEIGLYAAHTLLQLLGLPARPVNPPDLELVVRETT